MRRILLCTALLTVTAGGAWAQHPSVERVPIDWPPEGSGCQLCHGSHEVGGPGGHNLKSGDLGPGRADWVTAQAPGIGFRSLSCLRCHTTPSVRQRQREFAGLTAGRTRDAGYLGFDLTDDHVLGRIDPDALERRLQVWRDPRGYPRKPEMIVGGEALIECTTCHDPHDRVSSIPRPNQERTICTRCHETATYVFSSHSDQACSDCHRLHGSVQAALLAETDVAAVCWRCHGLGVTWSRPDSGLRSLLQLRATPLAFHGREGECRDCHLIHRH